MNAPGFSPSIQHLLVRLEAAFQAAEPVYIVGGAVRDRLLGRSIHDLDIVIVENGIKTGRQAANRIGAEFYPLDTQRDTGRIIFNEPPFNHFVIDVSSMRGPDIESDLMDRDFTINAVALDLHKSEHLIDPLGGAKDLLSKTLRPCSPTSISNDPVRILRAVRQSIEYEFKFHPETTRQIRAALDGLSSVSAERMRDELFRMLDGKAPASALRLIDALGALPFIFPELETLKGVRQPPPHNQDVWEHSLSVVNQLQNVLKVMEADYDPDEKAGWALGLVSLRLGRYRQNLSDHFSIQLNPERSLRALLFLAALYHDIGKPQTFQQSGDGEIHFFNHEQRGSEMMAQRAEALRLKNTEIERLKKNVRNHMRPLLLEKTGALPTRRAAYRFFRDTGSAGVDICLLSLADMLATYGPGIFQESWVRLIEVVRYLLESWWEVGNEVISPPDLLNGEDLIQIFHLEPGPLIGSLLDALKEAQAAQEIQDREQALEFIRAKIDQG
jgi:putative nucleotidyltransferase with HDIG domain